jgi:hypothetical protein
MAWAVKEARLCRGRFIARGFTFFSLEEDDLVSLIATLWWRVACGDLGAFSPKPGKSVIPQIQAYVAGCIDNEIMRYLHQEGNPGLVQTPRRQNTAVVTLSLNGGAFVPSEREEYDAAPLSEPWGLNLVDEDDPVAILARSQNSRTAPGWPGPIGELIEDWMLRAHEFDKREARALKARVEIEIDGACVDRANLAWVLVQAAYEGDPDRTRAIAPMLTARWIDQFGGSVKDLRAKIYPRLGVDISVADVARQESRDLLRFLSEFVLNDAAVSPEHLRVVVDDAAQAMVRWVGKRGPYKKRGSANASSTEDAGQFNQEDEADTLEDESCPMQEIA